MKVLTREEIMAVDDCVREFVEISEWGTGKGVYVQAITAGDRDKLEASSFKRKSDGEVEENLVDFRAKLAVLCTVDEEGNKIFKFEEYKLLSAKASSAVSKIFLAAQRINALNPDDIKKEKENLSEGQ